MKQHELTLKRSRTDTLFQMKDVVGMQDPRLPRLTPETNLEGNEKATGELSKSTKRSIEQDHQDPALYMMGYNKIRKR